MLCNDTVHGGVPLFEIGESYSGHTLKLSVIKATSTKLSSGANSYWGHLIFTVD